MSRLPSTESGLRVISKVPSISVVAIGPQFSVPARVARIL